MEKPRNFDTAKATGEYSPLPAGGYICNIIGVEEVMSRSGKPMIKIALDIAFGDEKDRFMNEYKNDTRQEKKWPSNAVVYQLVMDADGNTHGRFKQFTNCVEKSNDGFTIRWGSEFCSCFKGKLIGVLFGREQYESTRDGSLKWSTKPQFFKTVEEIRNNDFRVPEDRYLQTQGMTTATPDMPIPDGFQAINDSDIPF